MRKILSVIKREYIQMVRTKGFVIGTILGPVLMAAIILIPMIAALATVGEQKTIGIVDLTGEVTPELIRKLDHKLKDGRPRYVLENFPAVARPEELREELRQKVLAKELSAYLVIPEDVFRGGSAEYASEHVSDFDEIRRINEALNGVVIEKRLKNEGLDPEKIAEYIRHVGVKTIKVTAKGEEEDTGGTFAVSYVLVLILYGTLLFYGTIIMRGVIEEKNNRVVEVVISSLKPFQLMSGKILGLAAVGLTQYFIWALFGIALSGYGSSLVSSFFPQAEGFKVPHIPPYIFVYFVVFFVLGYFLYATIYAGVGSMVNSEKEAQNYVFPITMLLVMPMLLMVLVLRSPNNSLAVALSIIPFFAPVLMMLRICVLLPPFPQILASILLTVATTLLMIWLISKIYRVGILMYGKRPCRAASQNTLSFI